ncbi:unnamed protein product [Arabidopsis halleri]
MRNFLLQANLTAKKEESLVSCDLEVNYKICTRSCGNLLLSHQIIPKI